VRKIVHPDLLRACVDEEQLAKWLKVLQDNDVYTAQDWKDYGRDEGLRVSCGAKLRTILDNLAGVTASWEATGNILTCVRCDAVSARFVRRVCSSRTRRRS
jgi:hypothetical protein